MGLGAALSALGTGVSSLEAEHSVRLVMRTLAQHRRQEAHLALAPPVPIGRLRASLAAPAAAQVRRQATLLRLSSIVEAFAADQLVVRLESQAPPPRPAILNDVYTRAEDNALGSWPKLTEHYARWFRIKVSQKACPPWRRVEAMTNARNAVAHGLGELTRRMARKDLRQLERDFATVDIKVVGTAVVLSEVSLRSASVAAREFIEWLDEQLAVYDGSTP